MKARTLLAVVIAAAFSLPAASADGDKAKSPRAERAAGGSSAALFDRLDKNKDGFVTRDEARDATELQGRFAELDVNNDGKLSREEMRALDAKGSAGATGGEAPKSGVAK